MFQDQVSPWYRWWKSTVNVRLVMEPMQRERQPQNSLPIPRNSEDTEPFAVVTVNSTAATPVSSTRIDPTRISKDQRPTIWDGEERAWGKSFRVQPQVIQGKSKGKSLLAFFLPGRPFHWGFFNLLLHQQTRRQCTQTKISNIKYKSFRMDWELWII